MAHHQPGVLGESLDGVHRLAHQAIADGNVAKQPPNVSVVEHGRRRQLFQLADVVEQRPRHHQVAVDVGVVFADHLQQRHNFDRVLEQPADISVVEAHGGAWTKEGNLATDPKEAAILLPFGGAKGSGLSMMFECLSSVAMGNPMLGPTLFGREPGPPLKEKEVKIVGDRPGHYTRHIQNGVFIALDISQFTDIEKYKEDIDELVDGIKALPKADGVDEIFVPGEPEYRTHLDRSQNGIPLPIRTVQNLRQVAERLGVKVPDELEAD